MPERLDHIIVCTSRGQVELPWASRDMLLTQLQRLPSAAGIFQAFEAVDASRPVTLTEAQESMLHDVVQHWLNEVGARNLPPGIYDLRPMRHGLIDEDATAD